MKVHNFRELNIWKFSMETVESVYQIAEKLPSEEKFRLKQQIYGSSVSIPSNIAEGCGNTTNTQFIHYLNMSLSSSYELETQLTLIARLYNLELNDSIQ